jgi:hypothetical protein
VTHEPGGFYLKSHIAIQNKVWVERSLVAPQAHAATQPCHLLSHTTQLFYRINYLIEMRHVKFLFVFDVAIGSLRKV